MNYRMSVLAVAVSLSSQLMAAENTARLDDVEVIGEQSQVTENTGLYTAGASGAATGMDLSVHDTPQAVSVITRTLLDDFSLNTIDDALAVVPGVTVEEVETDRTYFTARGFDITNFQMDGVGTPIHWGIGDGDVDTFMYDRIDVVRGATGLMAGVGNPSATVNMVRKRPTTDTQGLVRLSAGRWNDYRLDADASGSLSEHVRGRLVASYQDKDSYLRDYGKELSNYYGVVETDLGPDTLLTLGVNQQQSNADSPMWGALTLNYADGSEVDYNVGDSTSADWAFWDIKETRLFAELKHNFSDNWRGRVTISRYKSSEDSNLLYVYDASGSDFDSATGAGLTGWASGYSMEYRVRQLDAALNGSVMLGGLQQDLVLGVNVATRDSEELSLYDYTTGNGYFILGDIHQWDGNSPRPVFTDAATGSDVSDKQQAIYAAGRFRLTEDLAVIAGGRMLHYESHGETYDEPEDTDADEFIPYAGVVYGLSDELALYASYSKTYNPQSDVDINQNVLDPVEGTAREAGIKAELFGGLMNAGAAYFSNDYRNVAEYAGFAGGMSYYDGFDYHSEGVELELAGELIRGLNLAASYTNLNIEDDDGNHARVYIPKREVKVFSSYRPDTFYALKVGGSLKWKSEISSGSYEQSSLTLVDLFAGYDVTEQLNAALNLNNVTNEKYLTSLNWSQAYYAAPRNASASVTWKF